MPKKKTILKPILAVVGIILFLLLAFLVYYLGFSKQTIYGLQGQYNIGDVIKFDAIDTGFTNNANARRPCYATVTIEKPDNTILTIASHDELAQSCVGAPCKSYTLPIVGMPLGERTLRIEYSCIGDVGNNGVDERTYNVVGVASTAKSCDDSDGGNNLLVKGTVHWSSVEAQYDYKNDDSCVSDSTVREYQCDSTKKVGYYNDLACPSGTKCSDGACVSSSSDCTLNAPTVMPTNYCKDGNVYADIQSVDRQACKLTSTTTLINICGADEPCSNGKCTSSVALGTERNRKCSDDLKSSDYQYFALSNSKYQWIDAHDFCIGNQKCSSATLKCELQDTICITVIGYIIENGQCKLKTCGGGQYNSEEECKKALASNCPMAAPPLCPNGKLVAQPNNANGCATPPKCVTPPTEFDFKEFMKAYGIAIGIVAVLVITGLIFGIKAMTKKRKK